MKADSKHMRYLDSLLRMESERGRHPSKRANWLKFCRTCGTDISQMPNRVRLCFRCHAKSSSGPC